MQMHLSEIVEEDMKNWSGLDEFEEDLDKAWHVGFASAIVKLEELLND
jgi:hypothetical protein